jgi:hypothetical protein
VELEFLDPGPDQPFSPPPPPVGPPPAPRRELVGLLIMLVAAAVLPLLAAYQSLYAVEEDSGFGRVAFTVNAWGGYQASDLGAVMAQGPRFGILLAVCSGGFAVLAALTLVRALRRDGRGPGLLPGLVPATVGLVAASAAVTAAMALEVESVFESLSGRGLGFGGPVEVRVRVGGAIWLGLAGVLAGGLAIAAARRAVRAVAGRPVVR